MEKNENLTNKNDILFKNKNESFKNRKQNVKDNKIEELDKDIDYYKRSIKEHFEKIEKGNNDRQTNLNKIKSMFFLNNEEYFNSISSYLVETFDYDILSSSIGDNCIRFELFDKTTNKRVFFAINQNLFLLNYRYKYKMNLRGNSSEEILTRLMNDIKNITKLWDLDYSDDGEYYWGLTLIQDNKCNLYVGKSVSVVNWNDLTNVINNIIEELLVNISKENFI